MKIYVDENVPLKITRYLRAEGHQVEYVTRSIGDKDILETAYKQKALLPVCCKVSFSQDMLLNTHLVSLMLPSSAYSWYTL